MGLPDDVEQRTALEAQCMPLMTCDLGSLAFLQESEHPKVLFTWKDEFVEPHVLNRLVVVFQNGSPLYSVEKEVKDETGTSCAWVIVESIDDSLSSLSAFRLCQVIRSLFGCV